MNHFGKIPWECFFWSVGWVASRYLILISFDFNASLLHFLFSRWLAHRWEQGINVTYCAKINIYLIPNKSYFRVYLFWAQCLELKCPLGRLFTWSVWCDFLCFFWLLLVQSLFCLISEWLDLLFYWFQFLKTW